MRCAGEQIVYTYESLNRLASATGSGWGQSYNYDGFGNLTDQNVTSGTAPALHVTYDPATNRRTGGECADANGNLNAIGTASPCLSGYTYDVENRLVAQLPVIGAAPTVAYSYKPDNKRVWRGTNYTSDGQNLLPANEELTFWSFTGQKMGTYNLTQYQPGGVGTLPQLVATQTGTNVYFGGELIKNATGYVTPDRLGSIGKYFPYGQERPSATADGKEKFATYFRDSETGLDYADQRYHQPGMGRFMTPDRMAGKPADPGSWNRYAYTRGDPVNRIDSAGTTDSCPPGVNFCYTPPDSGGGTGDDPDCIGPTCLLIDTPGTSVNTNCFSAVGLQPTDPQFQACFGGGGFAPFYAPRPECDTSNAKNKSYLDFINAHRGDAEKLASQLGVSVQDILGVAAEESAFGDTSQSNLAANNNFFGLHNASGGGLFPGQSGTYVTRPTTGKGVQTPVFSASTGFYDSGEVFVNTESRWLHAAGNPADPTTFTTIIHQHGYGIGTPNYVQNTVNVINNFAIRLNCP